jgi:arginyl-tRNA synthetase
MRTLKRLGNKWDNIWHESEHYQQGKDLIEKGLKEGVFVRDQGAVITNLKSYNLPNTVVIKKDGTSLYITQDLALNILKKQKFHADKMFWVIGPEQALAMKQVYAVSEQLGIGKIDEFTHIAYGYMTINGQGKMSSRKGNVLFIDNVIDMIKSAIKEKLVGRNFTPEYQEEVSEKLALAALKYNTLKVSRLTNVAFDIDAATDFNGDSAIYILYGLVRAKSILHNSEFEKVDVSNLKLESSLKFSEPSSETLYKKILEFPSVVRLSIEQFAPNYVCLYLFQLAQCFSQFYDGVSVLKETDENSKLMKLKLLKAYEITVTNGCRLLGIEAVEKM